MFTEENKFDLLPINTYLSVNKISKADFCKKCGIELEVLNKLYKNDSYILVSDLIKISNILCIPVASLFCCEYYSKIQTRFRL